LRTSGKHDRNTEENKAEIVSGRGNGEFGREGENGIQRILMALGIKSFLLNKYLLLNK